MHFCYLKYSIVFLSLAIFGCSKETGMEKSAEVARVGDQALYIGEILTHLPEFAIQSDSVRIVHEYRDNWITSQVLYQEALRIGIDRHPIVRSRIERSRRDIIVHELREQVLLSLVPQNDITNQEITSFYEQNRAMFVLQERHVRVRHMISETHEMATLAGEALLAGETWDHVVQLYAVDKPYSLETEYQLLGISEALVGFNTMRSYLQVVGLFEVSPIFKEDEYYHFIQIVEDRPPGDHPELQYVFEKIRDWIWLEKSRRALRNYEQNLYLQAQANNEIVIY